MHFGPGAFHRAHQADYVDRLLADDPRWGIAAVSLRSGATIEALARQQGRYTLAILDAEPRLSDDPARTRPASGRARSARYAPASPIPKVGIVTSTVTEKGYCLGPDGTLDFAHPDIVHDLATPETPRSLVGWLALGLADRRAAGSRRSRRSAATIWRRTAASWAPPSRPLPTHAMPSSAAGSQARRAFPTRWSISITPATDDALRRRVREATGFDDAIPVAREAYSAWVIEDVLPRGRTRFRGGGRDRHQRRRRL